MPVSGKAAPGLATRLTFVPPRADSPMAPDEEGKMKNWMIVVTVVGASAGLAQVLADPPRTRTREGEGDPEQMVCRSETEVGSRIARRRVCRTRAEWAALQQQQRDVVDEVQRYKPVICIPDGQSGGGMPC